MTQMYPGWQYQQPMGMPVGGMYPAKSVEGLVRVTGLDGAKAYQLPPNSSMPLFDGNNDLFYLKTTDGAGFPTIRTFRFEPVENPQPAASEVTRAEFADLVQQVMELKGMVGNGE